MPVTAFLLAAGLSAGSWVIGGALSKIGADADSDVLIYGGVGLVAAGLIFGPSAGHWYALEPGHALAFTGLRALGVGLGLVAIMGGVMESIFKNNEGLGFGLVGVGVSLWTTAIGLALYDVADAASAALRTNERFAQFALIGVSVAPLVAKLGPQREDALGLQVALAF